MKSKVPFTPSKDAFHHASEGFYIEIKQDGLVWDLVKDASLDDLDNPFFQQVAKCPSGRLVAWNKKTGEPVEPVFQSQC